MILDLQAACSTQHMVFWIRRMTCFFSPTFFLFSRFPQTLCCNLKTLKRRWTRFILPRHLHHQKALILLPYQLSSPNFFQPPVWQDALIDIQIKRIHEYKRRSCQTHRLFFCGDPYDSRGNLLKASVTGKCGTSPLAVAFCVVGMNLSCSLAWLRCEGSWWTSFMWFIATRTIILWDFACAFFFSVFFSQLQKAVVMVMDSFFFVGMALHVRISSAFVPGAEKEVPSRTAEGAGKGNGSEGKRLIRKLLGDAIVSHAHVAWPRGRKDKSSCEAAIFKRSLIHTEDRWFPTQMITLFLLFGLLTTGSEEGGPHWWQGSACIVPGVSLRGTTLPKSTF